jgi:predicted nucleic acid-binding protein
VHYLIDTNIISEVRKGADCHSRVAARYQSLYDESIYLGVLVLGEIRKGIERVRPKDPPRARALENWRSTVRRSFAHHILPIDDAIAEQQTRAVAVAMHLIPGTTVYLRPPVARTR